MKKKKLSALAGALALSLALSGCMAEEINLDFKQDGSGTAQLGVFISDEFMEEMESSMGPGESTTTTTDPEATPATRIYNGQSYTGAVRTITFSSASELTSILNDTVGSDTGADLDTTGGFQATTSTEDGKKLLTFSMVKGETEETTEAGADAGITVDMSGMEDAIIIDLSITFPQGVKSVDAPAEVYSITGNSVSMEFTPGDMDQDFVIVGILDDADPRDAKFPEAQKYDGRFQDVPAGAWYASSLSRAYNIGAIAGTSSTTFSPDVTLSKSQVTVMAARLRSTYDKDGEPFTVEAGETWYQPYVDYAIEKGIIAQGQFTDWDSPANRAEMAYVFAHCMPDEMYDSGENDNFNDVPSTHPYYDSIMKLYNSGIVAGTGGNNYSPDAIVTRAQAVVFVARLATPSTR